MKTLYLGQRVVVDRSRLSMWFPLDGGTTWEPASWIGTVRHIGDASSAEGNEADREITVEMDSPSPYGGLFVVYCSEDALRDLASEEVDAQFYGLERLS